MTAPAPFGWFPSEAARGAWLEFAAALSKTGAVPCETTSDPDAWFPPLRGDHEPAKRACRSCPVVVECRRYAIAADEQQGVWGALGPDERRAATA